jgi:RNA polymerase sigma-70 factor (ECF subfamily)
METLTDQRANDLAATGPGGTVALERQEAASQVIELLDTLPTNQQEVVRLKFQNSLSYKEISAITGLSVTNVGYLLHTAIQTLRGKLN